MHMTYQLDSLSLRRDSEKAKGVLAEVELRLNDLNYFYPSFSSWFNTKVLPNIATGERTILTEYRNGELAGLAILKDSETEKKLCCLRVFERYQSSIMGIRLFEKSFEILNTSLPLLSVSEEQLSSFQRVFNYFGFSLEATLEGYYRPNKREFVYNGSLSNDHLLISDLLSQRPDENFSHHSFILEGK